MSRVRVGELDVHVQRLNAVTSTPGHEAPIVVCVHGLLTDSLASYYFTLGPELAQRGVDVLMYDLRGHGRTTRPASGYQLEYFVDDLLALLDALDITRPVHLVGNSFGGAIAFGLAAARPDRVASVVSIEAEPPTTQWAQRMAEGLDTAKSKLVLDEVIDGIRAARGAHTARLLKAAGKLVQVTTMVEDIPRSATIARDLSAIHCPVFGIYGDQGLADQVPYLRANLADFRTVVLPDQGHSVLVERTAETIELITNWIGEYSRVSAAVA